MLEEVKTNVKGEKSKKEQRLISKSINFVAVKKIQNLIDQKSRKSKLRETKKL